MLSNNQTELQNKLKSTLLEFGLSKEESLVYLSGLELGATSVLKISQHSGVPRTTVYAIIHALHKKGLFKINITEFKSTYEAENPERLKYSLQEKIQSLESTIPDFLALYNLKDSEGFIHYYEGLDAIKALYMKSIKDSSPNEDYLVIVNQEQWFNIDRAFAMNYKEKRAKAGIHSRMLFQDSAISREHKRYEKNFDEEIRFLPASTSINVDFICTSKQVIIFQTQKPYVAISVENKFVIELYRNLFEIIWTTAPNEHTDK